MNEELPMRLDDSGEEPLFAPVTLGPSGIGPTDAHESAAVLNDVCEAGPLGHVRPACGE